LRPSNAPSVHRFKIGPPPNFETLKIGPPQFSTRAFFRLSQCFSMRFCTPPTQNHHFCIFCKLLDAAAGPPFGPLLGTPNFPEGPYSKNGPSRKVPFGLPKPSAASLSSCSISGLLFKGLFPHPEPTLPHFSLIFGGHGVRLGDLLEGLFGALKRSLSAPIQNWTPPILKN